VSTTVREQILPMQESDLDGVAALEQTLYVHPWTRRNFADSLEAGYQMHVLRRDAELCGYYILMAGVDEGHLLNISVARPWQRHGFGSLLIDHACELCRQRHATQLLLEVRPSNVTAQSLYRRRGFRQIGVRRGYYPKGDLDPFRREDALVMVLAL